MLSQGKGTLLGVSKGNTEESVVDISFSEVKVTKSSIGYIVLGDKQTVVPVYIFEGTVTKGTVDVKGSSVTYFTPALP